jgi:hypothetical protein
MKMIKGTNWSKPNKTFLGGVRTLAKALRSYNAQLIKVDNKDCEYPIKIDLLKNSNERWKDYEFSMGYVRSVNTINSDKSLSDYEKYLAINFVNLYGSREAVNHYYETGELTTENNKGVGVSHIVKREDFLNLLISTNDDRINLYKDKGDDYSTMFSFFKLKKSNEQEFNLYNKKVWVVQLLDDKTDIKIPFLVNLIWGLSYPLKFIPKRNVLKMDGYKCITYRIGGVTNGYSIELQIPKKFSFK